MRVGDVSRARRFANPARLRWYAFHRSVRFALRMMKAEDTTPTSEAIQHQLIDLPLEIHQCQEPCPSPDLNGDSFEQALSRCGQFEADSAKEAKEETSEVRTRS